MEDLFITGAAVRVNKSDPWYTRWWLQFIKPRCAIPAPKLLSLRDWRLGLANRIAQVTAPRPRENPKFASRFPAPNSILPPAGTRVSGRASVLLGVPSTAWHFTGCRGGGSPSNLLYTSALEQATGPATTGGWVGVVKPMFQV